MTLYTFMSFGCSYFHIFPAFLPTVFLCGSGANSAVINSVCLGAWSCAFCTSDLDVKYFFEPKFFFKKKFCVHVDFIVFLWITSFKAKINILSIKWLSIWSPWLVHQYLVLRNTGLLLFLRRPVALLPFSYRKYIMILDSVLSQHIWKSVGCLASKS